MRGKYENFRDMIANDPDLIWGWHSNIAMPIYDNSKLSHEEANDLAVKLMWHLFDIDSSTMVKKFKGD